MCCYILCFNNACDFTQNIELDLPTYEIKPVVETYIEAGQPYNVFITNSSKYFDPPTADNIASYLPNHYQVSLQHGTKIYPLKNELTFSLRYGKYFNYVSRDKAPLDYEQPFLLKIQDTTKNNQVVIRAITKLIKPVPIDTVYWNFSPTAPLKARIVMGFRDPDTLTNYYRFITHRFRVLNSPRRDLLLDDRFVSEERSWLFTDYSFQVGDTIVVTLYNLTKEHYDFLQSAKDAVAASQNPFAQPTTILSNVSGGTGIVTGLSYDSDTIRIK